MVVAGTLMIQKNRVTSGTLLIIVPILLRATVAVLVVVMVSRFSRVVGCKVRNCGSTPTRVSFNAR